MIVCMKTIETTLEPDKTKQITQLFKNPQEILFFDIETTGFSPKSASIYLIGCSFYAKDGWHIRQYFAETPAQEGDILRAFCSLAGTFRQVVHFNGITFDVPFIQAKCKKHGLAVFAPPSQCDIYKRISPYKNMLHLPGCRQKQLEEFVGIHREDKYDGGQLIELYHAYTQAPDERLLHVLLLHNAEDIAGMLQMTSILAVPMLFEEGRFAVDAIRRESCRRADGASAEEIWITLRLDAPLPVLLTCHGSVSNAVKTSDTVKTSGTAKTPDTVKTSRASVASGGLCGCFLSGSKEKVLLRLPVTETELKYFYPDYKNYSYLPAEDCAIHKSVAVYVDKSQRMPATAATCYTRRTGRFLPWFGAVTDEIPLFRAAHKDKQHWMEADALTPDKAAFCAAYVKELLTAFRKDNR